MSWVSVSSQFVGKFQMFINYSLMDMLGSSSPQYQADSFPIMCVALV